MYCIPADLLRVVNDFLRPLLNTRGSLAFMFIPLFNAKTKGGAVMMPVWFESFERPNAATCGK